VAGPAGLDAVRLGRAAPLAVQAGLLHLVGHVAPGSGEGLLQGDAHPDPQVAPPGRAIGGPPPAPSPAAQVEDGLEEVPEGEAEASEIGSAHPPGVLVGGLAEAVIVGPLLLVAQHRVGLVHLAKAALGLLLVLGHVRMVLTSQAFVGLLDVVETGIPRDTEDLVVILLGHGQGVCA